MGLLSKGTPLAWPDSLRHHSYIKYHGILQFLSIYNKQRGRSGDEFLWGDEVEHLITQQQNNNGKKKSRLSLRAAELIENLEAHPVDSKHANFLPEFGRFQIEATPHFPYGGTTNDLRQVEINMRERRELINKILHQDERLITLTVFPLLGCDDFAATSAGHEAVRGSIADSDYIMDEIIGAHPRFAALSRNIRMRRGARVDIRVPLFQDKNTQRDLPAIIAAEEEKLRQLDAQVPGRTPRPTDIDHTRVIHMDAMAFGMGNCCLQVTFQTRSLNEARHLYDHLAVLAPIMLSLTAASPFFRGRIADIDVRWTVISQSVDDRTRVEKGLDKQADGTLAPCLSIKGAAPIRPPTASSSSSSSASSDPCARIPQRLYKSRYDSISSYISLENDFDSSYNDIECEIDQASYDKLLSEGIDELLSRHIAHLFTRDPLVIYDEHIVLDDEKSSDHFENIQSTNWQTVRFKPPAPGSPVGWRVEFRTMEVQLTDFENAAFTVFIALVSRAILYFNLNLYIPLSKVDENLATAHKRNSVIDEKFYWRNNIQPCIHKNGNTASASSAPCSSSASSSSDASSAADADNSYSQVSIKEIMLGNPSSGQPGLINLVRTYLDMIDCTLATDSLTRTIVDEYLDLISRRASGELMTTASWLRKYVDVHPAYQHNSVLNQEIVGDIINTVGQIEIGSLNVPQLLGPYSNTPPNYVRDQNSIDIRTPGKKLKGAGECLSSSTSSSSSSSSGALHVLDLNEQNCCEKLRSRLNNYIEQSHNSNHHSNSPGGLFGTSPHSASATGLSEWVAGKSPKSSSQDPFLGIPK